MTRDQRQQFDRLETVPQRAAFLLKLGVTAKIAIVDLRPVFQAGVGDVALPVTADTEQEAIDKAIAWLEERAAA